jgi:hypothetical protein
VPFLREWNAHTRAAVVTLLLLNGERLTTSEIAKLTDMTYHGAYRLMINLSIELPITQIDGKWQRISRDLATS